MKRIFQCFGCKGSPCTLTLNNVYESTGVPKKCMYGLNLVNWKEKTINNESIKAKREEQKEIAGVLERLLEEHRRSIILPREPDKIPEVSGEGYARLPTTGGLPGDEYKLPNGIVFRYCAFGNPDSFTW